MLTFEHRVLQMGLIVFADVFEEAMGKLKVDLENLFDRFPLRYRYKGW